MDVDIEDDEEGDFEQKMANLRRRIKPADCLFCTRHSGTVDENVGHMASIHSFFIPDREILIDLSGLLSYLGEKVAIGNLCLFCPNGGKEFGSLEAVRKHMIDKNHCKLAYETDEDRAELADFYDFQGEGDDEDWEDEDGEEIGSDEEVMDAFDRPQRPKRLASRWPLTVFPLSFHLAVHSVIVPLKSTMTNATALRTTQTWINPPSKLLLLGKSLQTLLLHLYPLLVDTARLVGVSS